MEKNHFDNELKRRTLQEKRKGYLALAHTGILTLLFFPNFHLAPIEIQNDSFNFVLQLLFDIGLLVYPFLVVRKLKNTSIKILFGLPFVLIACILLPYTLTTCGVGFRDSVYYTSNETGDTIIYQSIPRTIGGGHRYLKAKRIISGVRWIDILEPNREDLTTIENSIKK